MGPPFGAMPARGFCLWLCVLATSIDAGTGTSRLLRDARCEVEEGLEALGKHVLSVPCEPENAWGHINDRQANPHESPGRMWPHSNCAKMEALVLKT